MADPRNAPTSPAGPASAQSPSLSLSGSCQSRKRRHAPPGPPPGADGDHLLQLGSVELSPPTTRGGTHAENERQCRSAADGTGTGDSAAAGGVEAVLAGPDRDMFCRNDHGNDVSNCAEEYQLFVIPPSWKVAGRYPNVSAGAAQVRQISAQVLMLTDHL